MPDPNFREYVVLVRRRKRGATGVIINRPHQRSLAEMAPSERFSPQGAVFSAAGGAPGMFAVFQADKFPARP